MENHRFKSKYDSAKARSNKKRIRQQKLHVNAQDSVHASVNLASSHTEDHYNQPKTPPHSVHATVNRALHDAKDHFNVSGSSENENSGSTEGLHIDDCNLMNLVLLEVEQLLQANQRSLKDYPSMPYPKNANLLTHADNGLILSELNFNNEELRS
ncbi:hypothetical protein JHK87_033828 [Glycine soja]|nr:hypothetical protein JHK87_033828 [Glycine soja]